jgi:hypothetical protein
MALVHALTKVSVELISIYFQSFEIINIQIEEVAFSKRDLLLSSQTIDQNALKGECFLDYF